MNNSVRIAVFAVTICSLVAITTKVSAAYPPAFYEERKAQQLEQKLQEAYQAGYSEAEQSIINTSRFDRAHAGAPILGKGKGVLRQGEIVQQAPLVSYVLREQVELPPLQDTGPALNILLLTVFGALAGSRIHKKVAC